MKHRKAIVTLASGGRYHADWRACCEENWRIYAGRHGFDVLCLDQPPDTTPRASARSVAWQKCLVPGLEVLSDYEQAVWIDSDILINHHVAPDITAGVPVGRVGGVEDINYSTADPAAAEAFRGRALQYWPNAVINRSPDEYYTRYGLPGGVAEVVNTGVLVFSPRHHAAIFRHVHDHYEEKGGREWHMEMRPLSYELVKAGLVHWIDPRFNLMWPYLEFMHYPYLLRPRADGGLPARIRRRLVRALGADPLPLMRRAALNAAWHNAYFLHFGGCNTSDMAAIDQTNGCWWEHRW